MLSPIGCNFISLHWPVRLIHPISFSFIYLLWPVTLLSPISCSFIFLCWPVRVIYPISFPWFFFSSHSYTCIRWTILRTFLYLCICLTFHALLRKTIWDEILIENLCLFQFEKSLECFEKSLKINSLQVRIAEYQKMPLDIDILCVWRNMVNQCRTGVSTFIVAQTGVHYHCHCPLTSFLLKSSTSRPTCTCS